MIAEMTNVLLTAPRGSERLLDAVLETMAMLTDEQFDADRLSEGGRVMIPAEALRKLELDFVRENDAGKKWCRECDIVVCVGVKLTIDPHHPNCPFAVLWDAIGERR